MKKKSTFLALVYSLFFCFQCLHLIAAGPATNAKPPVRLTYALKKKWNRHWHRYKDREFAAKYYWNADGGLDSFTHITYNANRKHTIESFKNTMKLEVSDKPGTLKSGFIEDWVGRTIFTRQKELMNKKWQTYRLDSLTYNAHGKVLQRITLTNKKSKWEYDEKYTNYYTYNDKYTGRTYESWIADKWIMLSGDKITNTYTPDGKLSGAIKWSYDHKTGSWLPVEIEKLCYKSNGDISAIAHCKPNGAPLDSYAVFGIYHADTISRIPYTGGFLSGNYLLTHALLFTYGKFEGHIYNTYNVDSTLHERDLISDSMYKYCRKTFFTYYPDKSLKEITSFTKNKNDKWIKAANMMYRKRYDRNNRLKSQVESSHEYEPRREPQKYKIYFYYSEIPQKQKHDHK